MYIGVWPACIYLCKGVGYSGTGIIDSCELSCGCWELIPGPLQEQPVFLIVEPFLQPQTILS